MKNKPLVSIIIPLYNGSNYVAEAIDSALAQTYENIEIVVVNDGSTDNGAGRDVVLSYGDKIRYFEKENGGCASALNYAISKAEGEYISWLSHDDLYLPDKIKLQIECLNKLPDGGKNYIISGRGNNIDSTGKVIPTIKYGKNGNLTAVEAFDYLLFERCFNGCGLLIPAHLFSDDLLFHENQRFLLDWNLWLRFSLAGVNFYQMEDVIIYNRQHGGQITVKHRELHTREKAETIVELSKLIIGKDKEYARLLYIFSELNPGEALNDIRRYVNDFSITVPKSKILLLKFRKKMRAFAKKIYHSIWR